VRGRAALVVQKLWSGRRARTQVRTYTESVDASNLRALACLSKLHSLTLASIARGARPSTQTAHARRARSRVASGQRLEASLLPRERLTPRSSARPTSGAAAVDAGAAAAGVDTPVLSKAEQVASADKRAQEVAVAFAESRDDAEYHARARRMLALARARDRSPDSNIALIQASVRGRKRQLVAGVALAELARPQRPTLSLKLNELGALRLIHRVLIRTLAADAEGSVQDESGGASAAAASSRRKDARLASEQAWARMYQ